MPSTRSFKENYRIFVTLDWVLNSYTFRNYSARKIFMKTRRFSLTAFSSKTELSYGKQALVITEVLRDCWGPLASTYPPPLCSLRVPLSASSVRG